MFHDCEMRLEQLTRYSSLGNERDDRVDQEDFAVCVL